MFFAVSYIFRYSINTDAFPQIWKHFNHCNMGEKSVILDPILRVRDFLYTLSETVTCCLEDT